MELKLNALNDFCERRKYQFLVDKYQFDLVVYVPVMLLNPKNSKNVPCKIVKPATKVFVDNALFKTVLVNSDIIKGYHVLTKGFLNELSSSGGNVAWNPFVCKVERRIFNTKKKRWFLIVSDGEKKLHRVGIASQSFYMFTKNIVKKGDSIYIDVFTATLLEPKKPKTIFFVKFRKVENTRQ